MTPKPRERLTTAPSGLVVVRYEMTVEQKKQRREDNKAMKKSRQMHRKRKKHGRS